ncbi:hypothetical protein HELRODRAFT_62499, partial [Helobdella robusta]|uniref:Phosphoinositide phospholipase C n=1 Tax=Helobdella robusta TaxID=6412 RepID=T1FX15_HELRO
GFYHLLNSEHFSIFKQEHANIYQDMCQPITNYFINSSHNTYLEGDQFNSYSKVECYINALTSGCRCVEIDAWDGVNEPVVCHGFAYTTKLLFSDVIAAINSYAFQTSKCPVIISIENHCGIEQQIKMAKIMRNTFKEKLYTEQLIEKCPCPSDLMGKIIIKKCNKKLSNAKNSCKKNIAKEASEDMFDDSEFDFNSANVPSKGNASKISAELSDLVTICQSTSFTSFNHSASHHSFQNICSFDENKALELAQTDLNGFIKHNMTVMSRTYPSGTRLKSSNYDPMPLWMAGCHIVSLNYQTPSQPMYINKGMFNDNGNCGFLLKPQFLRKEQSERQSERQTEELKQQIKEQSERQTEELKQIKDQLKLVKLEVAEQIEEQSTRIEMIEQKLDRFNPTWNFKMKFQIMCPELAMFLFEVYDYENLGKDVLVAQYSIRLTNIARGMAYFFRNFVHFYKNVFLHITKIKRKL